MPVDRGVLPPAGGRRGRERAAAAPRARRRQLRGHVRGRPRARLRGRQGLRRVAAGSAVRRRRSSTSHRRARRRDRGRHGSGQLRTGAASGVAARYLARRGARDARRDRLRLAGRVAGRVRSAPPCRRSSASSPTAGRRSACSPSARRSAPSRPSRIADAAEQDVVVTVTTSRDPVLRGEWLREGALVCAVGANDPRKRELDNVVLERASFVCCDSQEQARLESGDLIEPVEAGVLDWLEVHELQEVVAGEVPGRESGRRHRRLQVERDRGVGRRDRRRAVSSGRASAASGTTV